MLSPRAFGFRHSCLKLPDFPTGQKRQSFLKLPLLCPHPCSLLSVCFKTTGKELSSEEVEKGFPGNRLPSVAVSTSGLQEGWLSQHHPCDLFLLSQWTSIWSSTLQVPQIITSPCQGYPHFFLKSVWSCQGLMYLLHKQIIHVSKTIYLCSVLHLGSWLLSHSPCIQSLVSCLCRYGKWWNL